MGLTSCMTIGIILIIIIMVWLIFKTYKRTRKVRPYSLSLLALSLILLNWIFFLTGFYVIIAKKISNIIFTPSWFIVSIFGAVTVYREIRNNTVLAIINAGLSIINLVVGMLLLIIGSM